MTLLHAECKSVFISINKKEKHYEHAGKRYFTPDFKARIGRE